MSGLRDRISWFQEVPALRPIMVGIVDKVQHLPGHFQILGVAVTLHVLCKGAGIEANTVLQMIERMERDIDGPFAHQFAAMKEYARNELND